MHEIAPRIVVDEAIRFGRPVIRGTRVPVDLVVGKLAGGMTMDEVAAEYDLAGQDILAALAYAASPTFRGGDPGLRLTPHRFRYTSASSPAYSSTGGQEQTRWRSPQASSMRATAGQNLLSRTQGAGKAAVSRL